MSYLVLARKFRPQSFDEVTGQIHVTKTLSNAITRGKIAHAYVFAGPRGVGKTSLARIFAKALNCEKGPTNEPCGTCSNCREVTLGSSLAVREIDGASHNSVETVRDLIDTFRALPPAGWKYKVYIIDEVHMLSVSAFNALLKSLEEPPPNTVFILATTEVHKIPETVLSRCQRHDFRELSLQQIEDRLAHILKNEAITYEPQILRVISRAADGSMRDAQTLLERVIAYVDGTVTEKEVAVVLGLVERPALVRLARSVITHDAPAILEQISQIFSAGIDQQLLCKEFAGVLREAMLLYFAKNPQELHSLGIHEADAEMLREMIAGKSANEYMALYDTIRDGLEGCLRSSFPRASLEALLIRAALLGFTTTMQTTNSGTPGTSKAASDKAKNASDKVLDGVSATAPSIGVASAKSEPIRPVPPLVAQAQECVTKNIISSNESAAKHISVAAAEVQHKEVTWSGFIAEAATRGSPLVVEHLRRLSPSCFQLGVLKAAGPDFSITALLSDTGKRKLDELLTKYSGHGAWKVELKRAEAIAGLVPGSLAATEKAEKQKLRESRESSLAQHAAIEQIKRLFPGSTIESIKTAI